MTDFITNFLQQLVNGITIGAVYSLFGVGLTLIFGVMTVVNGAHGEIYMLGAYISFLTYGALGNLPVAILVALASTFFMGLLIDVGAVRRLRKQHTTYLDLYSMLFTFGLSYFLQNLVIVLIREIRGELYWEKGIPIFTGIFSFSGVTVTGERIVVFVTSVGILVALWFALRSTKIGKGIRATSMNRFVAGLMGINIERLYMLTFAISATLAGVAGVILSPMYMIFPNMGVPMFIKAFTIIQLGGRGSVKGAALAGFILGLLEAFGGFFIPGGYAYKDAISFLIMAFVVIFMPKGLFGK